jgi:hypothetical protein
MFCEDKLSEKVYHHAVRVKPLRGWSNRPQTADAIRSEPVRRAHSQKFRHDRAVAGG